MNTEINLKPCVTDQPVLPGLVARPSPSLRRGQQVLTPAGPGRVDARMEGGGYLVRLDRQDYLPAQWRAISPSGGPCVYRAYRDDDLSLAGNPVAGRAAEVLQSS